MDSGREDETLSQELLDASRQLHAAGYNSSALWLLAQFPDTDCECTIDSLRSLAALGARNYIRSSTPSAPVLAAEASTVTRKCWPLPRLPPLPTPTVCDADPISLYLKGAGLIRSGQRETGLTCLVEALLLDPFLVPAVLLLVPCVVSSQELLGLGLLSPSAHPWLHLVHVEVCLALTETAAAQQVLDSMSDGVSLTIRSSLYGQYLQGLVAYQLRDLPRALSLLDGCVKACPTFGPACVVLSNILFVMSDAEGLFRLASYLQAEVPTLPHTLIALGNAHSLKGSGQAALRAFVAALRMDPSQGAVWALVGHEALELKRLPLALSAYRRAHALLPGDYNPSMCLSQAYLVASQPRMALHYADEAIRLNKADPRLWQWKAKVLDHLSEPRLSLQCMRVASTLEAPTGRRRALLSLGIKAVRMGFQEEGVAYLGGLFQDVSAARESGQTVPLEPQALAEGLTSLMRLQLDRHCTQGLREAIDCARWLTPEVRAGLDPLLSEAASLVAASDHGHGVGVSGASAGITGPGASVSLAMGLQGRVPGDVMVPPASLSPMLSPSLSMGLSPSLSPQGMDSMAVSPTCSIVDVADNREGMGSMLSARGGMSSLSALGAQTPSVGGPHLDSMHHTLTDTPAEGGASSGSASPSVLMGSMGSFTNSFSSMVFD
ncbi:hypothetical protein KIPB_007849 [Kipferlia bialata]|uniref:Uncharacterized protein n=1 Tax=Kipferlia bialata TaxID=797122 RepID=A0A9K3GI26_9EUKA|nr:hypothetical protein KIPB_005324 [Kipferlia bialata]GIQ84704.1 hypothetical protein KIPB_006252 [Kipferlia bialata]GIQ86069.1 hypothetical protein KIPB_007849 [Kipferlia bialata]|eukprot:g5324.t1